MGNDYVNAMLKSLESHTSRVDYFELVGFVIKVSLSTFVILLI